LVFLNVNSSSNSQALRKLYRGIMSKLEGSHDSPMPTNSKVNVCQN